LTTTARKPLKLTAKVALTVTMYKNLKTSLFNILYIKNNSFIGLIFNYFIILLIFINIFVLIFESFNNVLDNSVFIAIEYLTVIVFTLEYLARLWTADYLYPVEGPIKSRLHFIFSIVAIVDLIAIIPFFLPFLISYNLVSLRSFRLIRLLRLLKLNRHTNALLTVATV
jgi:voltage-gated potassium channel